MTTTTTACDASLSALSAFDADLKAKGINMNDRAIVLIQACLAEGFNNGRAIREQLLPLGFEDQHLRLLMHKGKGQHWLRSVEGVYSEKAN